MAPFNRSCTTFYWSAVVNIALCCTIFELFEIIQNGTIRKLGCGLLFAFHGSTLHQFRDKARHWSKFVIFHTPFAFDAPLEGWGGGGTRRNFAVLFGMEKLKWWGYPTVKKL